MIQATVSSHAYHWNRFKNIYNLVLYDNEYTLIIDTYSYEYFV